MAKSRNQVVLALQQAAEALRRQVSAAVDVGDHPDLLEGKPTTVSIGDWKRLSPDDLRAAAKSDGISEEDMEEMADWEQQALNDGDVEALVAEGMSRSLADAIADGLVDELRDLSESLREAAIDNFVKFFVDRAKWHIKYETEGDGSEWIVDSFQSEVLNDDKELTALAEKVIEFLAEDEHPLAGSVSVEVLKPILEEVDLYNLVVNENEYREGYRSLWSTALHSMEDQFDGPDYDEDYAKVLRAMDNKGLKEAVRRLENDSPYISFPGLRGKPVESYYGFFDDSVTYNINEPEGWRVEAHLDMAKLNEALNELGLEKTSASDDIVYRFNGTNAGVGGASARGMYVASLRPDQLKAEGACVGICVGQKNMSYGRRLAAGEIKIYSIRSEAGKSKFTIEENLEPRRIDQVKGKGNRVPGFDSAQSTTFTKPDDVRLVAEFLLHLGYSPAAISNIDDMAPGVEGMKERGEDPFTPPKTRKNREMGISASSSRVRKLLARVRPWGHIEQVKAKLLAAFGPGSVKVQKKLGDSPWVQAKVLVPLSAMTTANEPTAQKAAGDLLRFQFGAEGYELGDSVDFEPRGAWVSCAVYQP